MKLARYQINAIANRIIENKKKEIQAETKKIRSECSAPVKRVVDKYHKILSSIPTNVREALGINVPGKAEMTKRMMRDIDSVEKTPLRSEIESKIILASIDSSTVEELKRKLNIKF